MNGRPVFGTASVVIPVGAWLAGWALDRFPHLGDGLNGFAAMFLVAFFYVIVLGGGVAGSALAVMSWVRREPFRFLGALGLALNLMAMSALLHGR